MWPIRVLARVSQQELEQGRGSIHDYGLGGCCKDEATTYALRLLAMPLLCPWQASLIDCGCVLVLQAVTTSRSRLVFMVKMNVLMGKPGTGLRSL